MLVPDSGLEHRLPPDARARAERALTAAMPHGGAAVARELERLAGSLGAAMPVREGDVNELPDTVDSDLDRKGASLVDRRSRGRPRR